MLGMKLSRERLNALTTAVHESAAAALGERQSVEASATLCRRVNGVIDAEIAALREEGAAVACAAGCNFCCHLRVSVLPHEAASLLLQLRTRMAPETAALVERRLLANAERIDGLTPQQHRTAGIACAFLVDGLCSAHDARPAACAAYHSLSRERCEQSFNNPSGIGTPQNARPVLLELQVLGAALIEAAEAAYAAAGIDGAQAELHQAVRALLTGG
jgi:hypothetical protein